MIVLDTNVLSEPLRTRPDPAVLGWFSEAAEELGLTSISVGEILTGARFLPKGRRRDGLIVAIEKILATFADRVLPYDEAAARIYAKNRETHRGSGRPLSTEDEMIASICLNRGATLATRNLKDFGGLGLDLVNPWDHRV